MKTLAHTFIISSLLFSIFSCTKDNSIVDENVVEDVPDNYSSIQNFYEMNSVPVQSFNINASAGGSFTASKGTHVIIPQNAFMTQSNALVSGNVEISFKEVYTKDEMFFSGMTTEMNTYPYNLVSGGMFYLKAKKNNEVLKLAANKFLTIEQPFAASPTPADSNMAPFVMMNDTLGSGISWMSDPDDSLRITVSNYVFSLYNFYTSSDSGVVCNSDNAQFFSAYSQTTLNLTGTDNTDTFSTDVFLAFKNINSLIHVYFTSNNTFTYSYAPVGLECSLVAIGVKDGKLFSSFTPITISNNQSVSFTLSETTTNKFKEKLKELN